MTEPALWQRGFVCFREFFCFNRSYETHADELCPKMRKGGRMRAIRRINNNVAVCEDDAGNELLAMGKGIGFGQLPRDLALADVERTFYNVDARFLSAINDLPQPVLDFAIASADYVRSETSYALSPNFAFILADHLAFAIKRAEQNIHVRMPLAYDVEQTYPDEYRLARHILRRVRRTFNVALPNDEATGIAMNIVNARAEATSAEESARQRADEDMLEDVTELVEDFFGVQVDRSSFAFSRYATHMRYLFERLHAGTALDSSVVEGFRGIEERYPEGVACVEKIARHIAHKWEGAELSPDEKLYLVIHVSRICIKGAGGTGRRH